MTGDNGRPGQPGFDGTKGMRGDAGYRGDPGPPGDPVSNDDIILCVPAFGLEEGILSICCDRLH